ncbi:MAG: hypothetical protein H0T73_06415 [Ardenticatenales bacterium]|nr:hypothetical protein [Ardenticatenales bacterium]
MDFDLPIRGLDSLTPLLAYLIIYLVILVIFRLFLLPLLLSFGRRGTIRKMIHFLIPVIFRTLLFGGLILGFIWALAELGVGADFYDTIQDALPTVPPVAVIGGLAFLFVAGLIVVLRRSFGGHAGKK